MTQYLPFLWGGCNICFQKILNILAYKSKCIKETETLQKQRPTICVTYKVWSPFTIEMGFSVHHLSVIN